MASWESGANEEILKTIQEGLQDSLSVLDLCIAEQSRKMEIPRTEGVAERCEVNSINDIAAILTNFKVKMDSLLRVIRGTEDHQARRPLENQDVPMKILYKVLMGVKDNDFMHLMRILEVNDDEMEECKSIATDDKDGKFKMLKLWIRKRSNKRDDPKRELKEALNILKYEDLSKNISPRCTWPG
ncbi:uncharacterized protein O3C94_005328 [Discoglossus pictus]